MPLVSSEILHAIDAATQLAGVVIGIGFVANLCRGNRWQTPFPTATDPSTEPTPMLLAGVTLLYALLVSTVVQLAAIDAKSLEISGSHEWHLAQSIDAVAKLVCSALAIGFITASRRQAGAPPPPRLSLKSLITLSLGTTLAILPIAFSQLTAVKLAWRLFQPDTIQPRHAVMEAFDQSAWGTAGIVQLIISAAVIAPIAEEVFFRGLILGAVRRTVGLNWPAILVSSAIFGVVHIRQPQDVAPLVTLGLILGFVRLRYNSLTLCILIHALFNTRTLAFILLNPEMARGF